MKAYYNEWEPYPAQWLRNLIKANLIAPGDVDERSIKDIKSDDLKGFTQCHFFAGIGGWSLALRLAKWADDRSVWTGSCPCQPFSAAGKRKGFDDERHLWPEYKRLIAERTPAIAFGEQVASATTWLCLVRSDLEAMGYAVGTMPIEAASAGADHLRNRFWFVADRNHQDGKYGSAQRSSDDQGMEPRGKGRQSGFDRTDDSNTAHQHQSGLQERFVLPECGSERITGQNGVADATGQRSNGRQAPSQSSGRHVTENDGFNVGITNSTRRESRESTAAGNRYGHPSFTTGDYEWVIGADGKARRVKSGIRLLADGFPCRVAVLRALGNAIDPRPAQAFIEAFMECRP